MRRQLLEDLLADGDSAREDYGCGGCQGQSPATPCRHRCRVSRRRWCGGGRRGWHSQSKEVEDAFPFAVEPKHLPSLPRLLPLDRH